MFNAKKSARQCIIDADKFIPGKPIEEVEREYGITNIIKLASNENPFGVSPQALKAMVIELCSNTHLYPEGSCFVLREWLADYFKLESENFFIDNGLDGVITMLGLTFISPGDKIVTSDLTFPAYKNITNKMDGNLVSVKLNDDFSVDIDGLIDAAGKDAKIVFLCNPNNPTGTIIKKSDFETIMEQIPDSTIVVSDEAYFEYVTSQDYPDTLSYLDEHKNLIVLRTFSKIMGMAAVRLGYAIADKSIVNIMMKAREPFPVNRVAQAGAIAALGDYDFMDKVLKHTKKERDYYYSELVEYGFSVYESHTSFVFAQLNRPAGTLYEDLLREGIIVRPISYGEEDFFRITIGTKSENRKLIKILSKILGT